MKINEIFFSLEGEGRRVGQPCVFIRRSGCNLHCIYDGKDCDTPYRNEGKEMSVSEIMEKVRSFGCSLVTLTGGEPLLPDKDLLPLRKALNKEDFSVNIETNGTMSTEFRLPNEVFTVDFKCNCSGQTSKMNIDAFRYLKHVDSIKFVVSDKDFAQVRAVIKEFKYNKVLTGGPRILLSPCFGRCKLPALAEFVKKVCVELYPATSLSLQTHKIIWSPEMRGV